MDTVEPNYTERVSPATYSICGQKLHRRLCDDEPGVHTYIWACMGCQREYGPEWEEYHATGVCTG